MNYLDLLVMVAVGFGVWRGRRRGLARELPSVLGWTVFFVTGAGLFHWTNKLLIESSQITRQSTGAVSVVVFALIAFQLVRKFRMRLREWAARRFADQEARLGAVAGGVRWLIIVTLLLVALGALPCGFIRGSVREYSLWGRLTHRLIWPALRHHNPS